MVKCIVCSCLLLAIPAAASAADLSPIVCDGVYPYHLQGVATDGTNIFWSFTTVLAKTDLAGRCLAKVERATARGHMGDLCCHGGKVFVGINNGEPGGTRPGDEVWVYDAETLALEKRIPTPQTIFCNNGIEWYGGYFFVVGSAPADHEFNYVWQYTEDFRFERCMPIRSGKTLLGVQTICHLKSLGRMAFGHYGSTPTSKGKPVHYVFFVKPEDLVQPPVSGIPDSEKPPVVEICGSESWSASCGILELNGVVFKALTSQGKDKTWSASLLPIVVAGSNDMDNPALTHHAAHGANDVNSPSATRDPVPAKVTERIELLKDGDISKHWYTWLKGEGRDSDPKKVFAAEGNTLKVSGEGMGCVTTRKAYRDYRLSLEFRYVDNEVQLNKTAARDGGILFHSTGEDGVLGPGIWMSSFEYNIIQGATGDLIVVGDDKGKPGVYRCKGRVDPETKGKACQRWKVDGEEVGLVDRGRIRRPDVSLMWKNLKSEQLSPNEKPIGDWNKAEVVCRGDKAEFYFNGMKTGEYWDLNPTSGRIQLQSEGFGIEYRNIVLEPVE